MNLCANTDTSPLRLNYGLASMTWSWVKTLMSSSGEARNGRII